MILRSAWLWVFLVVGCRVPLDGAACPCAAEWLCCEGGNVCVRPGELCPAVGDEEPCVAGENCPGDPLPGDAVGAIAMGVAEFEDESVVAGRDIVVRFSIVATTLNRATSFPIVTAAFLNGGQTVRLQTVAIDDDNRPISKIVLPATTTRIERRVRVRISIPDNAPAVPAYVVLGLSTLVKEGGHTKGYAPSSGRVPFQIGSPRPAPNAFGVGITYLINLDDNRTFDFNPEYAIINAPRVGTVFFSLNFLVDLEGPVTLEGTIADGSWTLFGPGGGSGNGKATVDLRQVIPWDVAMPPPATEIELIFRSESGKVATMHYGFWQP